MSRTVHRGTFSLDDRVAGPYVELPVDVPAGARALSVGLAYDRGAGVLDLGCLGPDGSFRGWSGGARDGFVVTPDVATPGYVRGPLEPGAWRVLLGLHRVPPAGLAYEVVAETGPGTRAVVSAVREQAPSPPRRSARPPRRDLPAPDGMRWLAGDLHAHTVHSDGDLTVEALACLAVEQGLDFLAVTDHNTVSHHVTLASAGAYAGIVLVPGQEVTTDLGHASALGDLGWLDFREPADRWRHDVEQRGGLLSVNHPLAADCAWRHPLTVAPPLAELWHGTWLDRRWGGPLAWWQAWTAWADASGDTPVPVGGSDFHRLGQGQLPGRPTTWVACTDEHPDGVLDGLRAGRTAVSVGRDGPLLLRVEDEVVAVDAEGLVLCAPTGGRLVVRGSRVALPAQPGLHRLETHDNAVVALCA